MKFTKAEIDAIVEASPRTFVPFNKLVLSQDYQAQLERSGDFTTYKHSLMCWKQLAIFSCSFSHH